MLAARTVLLLVLFLTSLHPAAAHFSPTECCFNHVQKPIRNIESFYHTPRDCSMPAVVFVTANGAEICADPQKSWVKRVMKRIQKKK
ncbi:C-C motif chemokine 5-like [Athene cunicularia]|uniref:C-C motif chemokine 5-like n=1 Tax=Athene cunicularia TaxID=194338 RepID=UPI000EF6493E|nr:C-C motif chemokine 5-like [Athene cunicularia]